MATDMKNIITIAIFVSFFSSCSPIEQSSDSHYSDDSAKKSITEIPQSITGSDESDNFIPEDEYKELVSQLNKIREDDQADRTEIEGFEIKFGYNSKQVQDLWKTIARKDSINLNKIEKILSENGWPSVENIGKKGVETVFLVLQHSDLKTQLKYLSLIKKAAEEGNIDMQNFAMFIDRIELRKGKKQIYGTQIITDTITGKKHFAPLFDSVNINKRRAEVNLPSIEVAAEVFQVEYKSN